MAMRPAASASHVDVAVIDAIRSFHTQNDRWQLADALEAQIPSGTSGVGGVTFGDIIDAANKEGVLGKLSIKTLNLYRDTAVRWPINKRVANVSFSAHREAQALTGTVDDRADLLRDAVKNEGSPDKVTVASVRAAIRGTKGKPATTQPSGTIKGKASLGDLLKGGPDMIKAIGPNTPADELDKLHAGLTKVIAHVEKLRAKAAQRAAAASNKKGNGSNAPTPIATARKAAAPPKGGVGDLRGL